MIEQHFQRALAYEKLYKTDKAIDDYTKCLVFDKNCATAYFNRSGLFKMKFKYKEALDDINMALKIEPKNLIFLTNKQLLSRDSGCSK